MAQNGHQCRPQSRTRIRTCHETQYMKICTKAGCHRTQNPKSKNQKRWIESEKNPVLANKMLFEQYNGKSMILNHKYNTKYKKDVCSGNKNFDTGTRDSLPLSQKRNLSWNLAKENFDHTIIALELKYTQLNISTETKKFDSNLISNWLLCYRFTKISQKFVSNRESTKYLTLK